MKIVNSNKISKEHIDWDDIEYGDVFAYADKECYTGKWIGMKACSPDGDDVIVDFETSEIYKDITAYMYLEILDAELKINISNNED